MSTHQVIEIIRAYARPIAQSVNQPLKQDALLGECAIKVIQVANIKQVQNPLSVYDIRDIVCELLNIKTLLIRCRKTEYVMARKLFIYFCYYHKDYIQEKLSYGRLGELAGLTNHTSALAAKREFKNFLDSADREAVRLYETLILTVNQLVDEKTNYPGDTSLYRGENEMADQVL